MCNARERLAAAMRREHASAGNTTPETPSVSMLLFDVTLLDPNKPSRSCKLT
jgi:hypothetical protein